MVIYRMNFSGEEIGELVEVPLNLEYDADSTSNHLMPWLFAKRLDLNSKNL